MLERDVAESVLFRLAVASIGYYPDKSIEEPGYALDEDLTWCIEPLGYLPGEYLKGLLGRMREVIIDPTTHRREFTRDLLHLITD